MSKPKFKISCEASDGKAVIRIDGYISSWSNNAAGFKAQLDSVIALGITTADVYINSGGGSCFEANEIANELGRFKGTKNAIIGALCASSATYIACICDTATGAKNMSYMIHKPLLSVDGNADEIESQLKLLRNMQAVYAQTYVDKTGLSFNEIETMWREDYWMNATEAKKLGFIDNIAGEVDITPEDILSIENSGYKNAPKIAATTRFNNIFSDRSTWTYADYQERDWPALKTLAETNETKFKELASAHFGPSFGDSVKSASEKESLVKGSSIFN